MIHPQHHDTGRALAVLIVDDEAEIRSVVGGYLKQEGYAVSEAADGREALDLLSKQTGVIDVVLLDWMMPGMSGLEVCRKIREITDVPVIFLTARTDEVDKLLGLELGADDYMTKPFSVRELAARIKVLMRRAHKDKGREIGMSGSYADEEAHLLRRGSLVIDTFKHQVLLDGGEVTLTPTEYKLLAVLAGHPSRVYSRLQLLELALGEEYAGYERSIDTHISNLRKKLEQAPANPQWVLTVFGFGYKFGEHA